MKACPKCGKRFLGTEEYCPNDGSTLADMDAPREDPVIGTTLDGRYTIEKKLGEGGMGVVYLATHAVIGKKCAVKVLRGELSSESEVAARFTQEARAAAAIGNEHIIEINDFGQLPDGSAYFVMEYLDGPSLHDLIKTAKHIDADRAFQILAQCCEALSAAHAAKIVHRDLKPENIVLISRRGNQDFVKILDFGIAKVARESGRLTRTGVIFGTPQYMSPEQAAGTDIDTRTDIYSLGIILYEMLTGHVPFEADTFMGVLTKHLYEDPIPPRNLVPPIDVSQNIQSVLLKAIAKKPDKRYQLMGEFAQDVEAILAGKTPKIAYDSMRATSTSTLPPPSPTEVVTGHVKYDEDDEIMENTRSKKPLAIAAGVGIAAIVTLFVVFAGNGDETKGQEAQNTQQNQAVSGKPAEKKTEVVTIASKPEGAELYKDTVLLGTLPQKVLRPGIGEDSIKYHLLLTGFAKKQFLVTDRTPSDLEVILQAEPAPDTPAATPRATTGTPSPEPQAAAAPKKKTDVDNDTPPDQTRKKPPKRSKKKKRTRRKTGIGGDIADPWSN